MNLIDDTGKGIIEEFKRNGYKLSETVPIKGIDRAYIFRNIIDKTQVKVSFKVEQV